MGAILSVITSFFGSSWKYIALAGVLVAGYFKIKSIGYQESQEDAQEAVTDATEDLKEDADRIQKKVNEDSKKADIYRDIN